jgi:hypothetical protein
MTILSMFVRLCVHVLVLLTRTVRGASKRTVFRMGQIRRRDRRDPPRSRSMAEIDVALRDHRVRERRSAVRDVPVAHRRC